MNHTLSAYNNSAQVYDERFSTYTTYLNKINDFAQKLPEKSNVLDLGCGSGVNAEIMERHGHAVTGVDFSESMLEIARKRCPSQTFIQSAANSLAATPEKYNLDIPFDALCLSFLIVHLNEKDCYSLLDNLDILLAEDGFLYLSFMPHAPGKEPGLETTSFSKDKIYFHYHDSESVIRILEKNGFILESEISEDYIEKDGSLTVDLFLIFRKMKKRV